MTTPIDPNSPKAQEIADALARIWVGEQHRIAAEKAAAAAADVEPPVRRKRPASVDRGRPRLK